METFLQTVGSLNDESRLKILRLIYENGEVCVCDIESSFDMIQSRVSRHLKILKDAGFLKVDRKGRWAFYSIANPLDKFKKDILAELNQLNLDVPQLDKECNIQSGGKS